jgi:hypothetical protein
MRSFTIKGEVLMTAREKELGVPLSKEAGGAGLE